MKSQLRKYLTEQGIYWDNVPATPYTREGAPDIYCILDGHFIGIEGKTLSGRQRVRQKVVQEQIEASGGEYWVIRSLDELKARIEDFRGQEYTNLEFVCQDYNVRLDTLVMSNEIMLRVGKDGITANRKLSSDDLECIELWCRFARRFLEEKE